MLMIDLLEKITSPPPKKKKKIEGSYGTSFVEVGRYAHCIIVAKGQKNFDIIHVQMILVIWWGGGGKWIVYNGLYDSY